MIKLTKVGKEARVRDYKRKRLLLQVGTYKFHLTREETLVLGKQIINLLNRRDK